jgi:tetratricopeptide (TPR) repeat protein
VRTRFIIKSKHTVFPLILPYLLFLLLLSACTDDKFHHDHFYKAEESFASGKLEEAAKFYQLFLEKERNSPKRILAWERLLLIHLDIGRDVEQGVNILKSMSLENELEQDKLWSVFVRIGKLYVHQGQFESGIEMLERSLEIAGDDEKLIQSHESLADAYYRMQDYPMALEVLYNFLESTPETSPKDKGRINYLLGKIYYQQKDLGMAIYYLRETLYSDAEENERSKAGMLLCDAYLDENDQDRAQEVIKELESFYPNPMVIRMRLEGIQ